MPKRASKSSGTRSWWSKTMRAPRRRSRHRQVEDVGRIAHVDHIECSLPLQATSESPDVPECQPVLDEVAPARRPPPLRIPVDLDAVAVFVFAGVALLPRGLTTTTSWPLRPGPAPPSKPGDPSGPTGSPQP